jgi:hypothetical protein
VVLRHQRLPDTSSTDKHFTEEGTTFLVLQTVDGEDLLAVHIRKAKDSLDLSKRSLNLLWSSNITTSELLMMASFTIGEPMISWIS